MTNEDTNADELRSYDEEKTRAGLSAEWDDVPTDPDPKDLGHEIDQWERIPTTDDEQVIFLPSNEEDIEEAAFLVLEESDLCDLVGKR